MKKVESTKYIHIGKIGSTFGIQGWLKIQSYTELKASILDYHPWYIQNKNGEWEIFEVEEGRVHGDKILFKPAGINTPEAARLLTGKLIAITREQLPALKKNEYYWSDLTGLTVLNKNREILGKVSHLMTTGANDVLVIKGKKEHAIPYRREVVLSVDLEKQEIIVDWELI